MKKVKFTGQQIKFIINMLGLAIFAFSYLYIHNGFVNRTKEAYNEVDTIKTEISILKKRISEEDAVLKDTKEINAQIEEILDGYPVNIKKTDNLMFVQQIQDKLDINLNTIIPTDSTPIFDTVLPIRNADGTEVDQSAVQTETQKEQTNKAQTNKATTASSENAGSDAGETTQNQELDDVESTITEDSSEGKTAQDQTATNASTATAPLVMQGLQSTITMNFQTTYDGFKRLAGYIKDYPDQTVIDSVSVSKDPATGKLTGSIVLKRFALSGTGKVYENPMIDDIKVGTDNIFGTDTKINQGTEINEEQEETAQ